MTPQVFLAQYGIWYLDNPLSKKYELSGASVVFEKEAGIVVTVLRADGSPKIGDGSLFICNIFPDGNGDVPVQPNGSGVGSFQGAASSAYTPPQRGPFTITLFEKAEKVWYDDGKPPKVITTGPPLSPSIAGMGDYQARHTQWLLQLREIGVVQPPHPDVPTIKSADELRNLAYGAIYPTGISFLPTAALVVAARSHGLGVAVTNEGTFLDPAGRLNRWQAFSGGIVACLDGHYAMADFIVTPW